MTLRSFLIAASFLLLCSVSASAQQAQQAQVVSSCGTPNHTYTAGTTQPLTQDTTGRNCNTATGGGGGSVTQGTVPWVVDDATGANFASVVSAVNSSVPAGPNIIGKVGIDQTTPGATNGISEVSAPTGGATGGTILSAASNNSTSIKASAGTLYSLTWLQTTTTLMDIRFYDTAGAPTCSSATGMKLNFVVQSNAVSAGSTINLGPTGIAFTTGIGICITGANANNDNTNATTGLNVIYGYN